MKQQLQKYYKHLKSQCDIQLKNNQNRFKILNNFVFNHLCTFSILIVCVNYKLSEIFFKKLLQNKTKK